MELGIKHSMEQVIDDSVLASSLGSGGLPIFGTPCMILLMEATAFRSVEKELETGQSTVGTRLEVNHLSPTPKGAKVVCHSELVEIDRRKLVFDIKVYDDCGLIGEARHERFIINVEKFLEKANSKLSNE